MLSDYYDHPWHVIVAAAAMARRNWYEEACAVTFAVFHLRGMIALRFSFDKEM